MIDFTEMFSILRIILFGLSVLVAFVYSIPILFIRRFHHRNNILTFNICLATICCCLYWFVFYIILRMDPRGTYKFLLNSCVFVFIVPTILTLQIPFSFVTVSINRFCSVVYYHKNFFKTKQWILICILSQWVLGTIITLPILSGIQLYCGSPKWVEIYKLIFIVIVPSLVFLVINILIYLNVRSSSRRIQPLPSSVTENNSTSARQAKLSRRDIHLLRHMVVMLSIFVGGWAPLYVLFANQNQFLVNPIVSACFTIWCRLALLCDIIDLYLYNHEIRNYLKTTVLRCFH